MLRFIKKTNSSLFITIFIIILTPPCFATDIYYNNHLLKTDIAPFIENGRTLVPISIIAQNMGAKVKWHNDKKLITISRQNTIIHIEIGNSTLLTETNEKRKVIKLDVPAKIINDRTMFPLRAISEIFGCDVKWDKKTNSILIDSDKNLPLKSNQVPSIFEYELESILRNILIKDEKVSKKDKLIIQKHDFSDDDLSKLKKVKVIVDGEKFCYVAGEFLVDIRNYEIKDSVTKNIVYPQN